MNILDKLPKRQQPEAKSALHRIWQSDSRQNAEKAFERFVATYEQKYPKAVDCLVKDHEELLAFYDFPAAHWQHESDRIDVRNDSAANEEDEELSEREKRTQLDPVARDERREALAAATRLQATRRRHCRSEVDRRCR